MRRKLKMMKGKKHKNQCLLQGKWTQDREFSYEKEGDAER